MCYTEISFQKNFVFRKILSKQIPKIVSIKLRLPLLNIITYDYI